MSEKHLGWKKLTCASMENAGESEPKMEAKLYVGNLSKSTTQDELNTLLAQAGKVMSVEVIKDQKSGESKGFAFITMSKQSEADQAIRMLNLHLLRGHTINIGLAISSENRDVKIHIAP